MTLYKIIPGLCFLFNIISAFGYDHSFKNEYPKKIHVKIFYSGGKDEEFDLNTNETKNWSDGFWCGTFAYANYCCINGLEWYSLDNKQEVHRAQVKNGLYQTSSGGSPKNFQCISKWNERERTNIIHCKYCANQNFKITKDGQTCAPWLNVCNFGGQCTGECHKI